MEGMPVGAFDGSMEISLVGAFYGVSVSRLEEFQVIAFDDSMEGLPVVMFERIASLCI